MNRDRLIKTALLASVGLNLFLAGTIVPRWLSPKPPHDRPMAGPEAFGPGGGGGAFFAMRRMIDDLPPADAAILNEHFGSDVEKLKEMGKSLRDRIDRLRALVKADPFDPAALRTEMEKAMADRDAFERSQMESVIEALGKLSPEGRKKLAEMPPPRMLGERHGIGPGGPGGPPPGGIPMDPDRGPMNIPSDGPPPPPPGGNAPPEAPPR